jgi:hypothetical protein
MQSRAESLPNSGELPKDYPGTQVTLSNGDIVSGTITGLRERKLLIDAGALERSLDDVQFVDFGGSCTAQRSIARLRLPDGCAIELDRYHYENHELIAHSETLGDLRLPANAMSELLFDPPLSRPPHPLVTKKAGAEERESGENRAAEKGDK